MAASGSPLSPGTSRGTQIEGHRLVNQIGDLISVATLQRPPLRDRRWKAKSLRPRELYRSVATPSSFPPVVPFPLPMVLTRSCAVRSKHFRVTAEWDQRSATAHGVVKKLRARSADDHIGVAKKGYPRSAMKSSARMELTAMPLLYALRRYLRCYSY